MIDLHLHILPGIDDGAATLAEATTMAAQAADLGYTVIAATPHLMQPLTEEYEAAVAAAHRSVRAVVTGMGLELVQGFEVMLTSDVPGRLAAGEPITLGQSRAILVELPFVGWPMHADTTLFSLQTAGFRPVLAHPERYSALQDDPSRAHALVDRGVILQVTVGTLTGEFGRSAQRVAERWLSAGQVGLVATDAHSSGTRMRAIENGLDALEKLVGADERHRLTTLSPAALLADEPLPPLAFEPTVPGTRRRWWFGRR